MCAQTINILLVDDSTSDAKLAMHWLRESPLVSDIQVASDGEQAMELLRKRGSDSEAPRPQLILLDVNLPRMSGFEVLAEIKADKDLATIPVIMLTSSVYAEDQQRARRLKASCYFPKPYDADGFAALVASIETFWHGFRANHSED